MLLLRSGWPVSGWLISRNPQARTKDSLAAVAVVNARGEVLYECRVIQTSKVRVSWPEPWSQSRSISAEREFFIDNLLV